jgi:hypothetical protein
VLFGCEVCSSGWLTLIGCGQYLLLMLSAGVVGVNEVRVRSTHEPSCPVPYRNNRRYCLRRRPFGTEHCPHISGRHWPRLAALSESASFSIVLTEVNTLLDGDRDGFIPPFVLVCTLLDPSSNTGQLSTFQNSEHQPPQATPKSEVCGSDQHLWTVPRHRSRKLIIICSLALGKVTSAMYYICLNWIVPFWPAVRGVDFAIRIGTQSDNTRQLMSSPMRNMSRP